MDDEIVDSVFGDSRKWIAAIVVLLVFLGVIGTYYIYALKSIRMESIRITDVNMDDGENVIMLDGEIQLYNPSILPLDIDGIEYTVSIDENPLDPGNIHASRIPPKQRITMPFKQNTGLFESDMITLADKGRVAVMVHGTIIMAFLGMRVQLPFREEHDLRPLIESEITAIAARRQRTAQSAID